ncbi:MAG: hypothetical protein MK212_03100 [Saprospiraceae bacterium]|nr:hypothetical protein [Saprospiraceae bacterium]
MSQLKSKVTSILLLLFGSALIGYADYNQFDLFSDHPFLKSLKEKLDKFQQHYSPDKVHVHLNNTFFKPGEAVWFAAYIRDAQSLQPSSKSGIAYVELLNPKGSVLQKHCLIIRNGKAAGEFELGANLNGGIYKIKAYTNWQKNENTFFEREITIQKAVLPNLNMQLNFEKKAYGPKDEVRAILDLNTLTKEALANHDYNFVVSVAGKELRRSTGKTNESGRAYVAFELPEQLNSNDGLVNILLKYKGQTESISRSIPITLGDIDMQFFPEGGEWVAGLNSTVAFKASNEFGKPADVEGEILDSKGNKVAEFGSYHQGMGAFTFKPQAKEQYTAKITKPSNAKNTIKLPLAYTNNYTINLGKQTDKYVEAYVLSPVAEELYIVAQQGGKMYYSEAIQATQGFTSVRIPTKGFPIGITQITLFDNKQIARAERLVFVNKHKHLKVEVKTDKEKYLPREKVDMTIKVTDENDNPVEGDFSIAVVDDKLLTFADDKQGQILASLLLEGDLDTKIEEPNFYFDDETDPNRLKPEVDRKKALDYLLMTEGWRRFTWKAVQAENLRSRNYPNERAVIAGYVQDLQGKKLADATVKVVDGTQTATTDQNGYFILNNVDLYKTVQLEASSAGKAKQITSVSHFTEGLYMTLYGKRKVSGVLTNEKGKPAVGLTVKASKTKSEVVKTNSKGEFTLMVSENDNYIHVSGNKIHLQGFYVGKQENTKANFSVNTQRPILRPKGRALRAVPAPMFDEVGEVDVEVDDVDFEMDEPMNFADGAIPEPEPELDPMPMPKPDAEPVVVEEAPTDEPILKNEADKVVLGEKKMDFGGFNKDVKAGELAKKPVDPSVQYYRARQFPEKKYKQGQRIDIRNDFRTTIYWNPSVKTNKLGIAQLSFCNSDAITQFRVSIEGISNSGKIAQHSYKYFTQMPFEMITKVPSEVISGDMVHIPLTLTNNTNRDLTGKLRLTIPKHLQAVDGASSTVSIPAKASKTLYLKYKVLNKVASGDLEIAFKAQGMRDVFQTEVASRPRGFPVNHVFASQEKNAKFLLQIDHLVAGSMTARVKVYPSVVDEAMSSMESMMRMPSGCFEQTSSSNYPNLLALDYMRETGTSNKKLEDRAKQYLATGYKRLTGYESPSGGFHWWGYDPGHEALTAYGLMQFVDMKAVYDVDQDMINRTAKWLLSRRDGKGGWNKNSYASHNWAVSEVTDAYLVYALCESGYGSQITKELEKSYQDAIKSEDAYMMALMSNAMYAVNRKTDAEVLLKEIVKLQAEDGSFNGLTSSVVNSRGHSLKIETTGLTTLAMLKTKGYHQEIRKAVSFIQQGKGHYGYGSTQGTVLALKALLAYAKDGKKAATDGNLALFVNGKKVSDLSYKADQKEIKLHGFEQYLSSGKQKIEVKYEDTEDILPYDIEVNYSTSQPDNAPECVLKLETNLAKSTTQMGETVRLSSKVINTTNKGQAMTMAMIGIPAGLSVQHWQLKELQDKKVFDYYELFNGYVVLHYEQMKPSETRTVEFDLKADIPGTYEAPASSAFLYYTNEFRNWDTPSTITIN